MKRIVITENLITVPNIITVLRIFLLPFIFSSIVKGETVVAFTLSLAVALSDALDGFLARWMGSISRIGEILDPFADRLMVLTITLALAISETLPFWIFYGFLFRELVATISYVYFLKKGVQIKVIREGRVVAGILYGALILSIIYRPAASLISLLLIVYIGLLTRYALQIIYRRREE